MRKPNSLQSAIARRASMRQSPKDASTNARNIAMAQKRNVAGSQKAKSGPRTPPAPKADQSRAAQMQAQQALDAQKRAAGTKSRFNSRQEEALKKYNSKTSGSPVRSTPRPTMKTPPKPTSGTTKPRSRNLMLSRFAKRLRGKR